MQERYASAISPKHPVGKKPIRVRVLMLDDRTENFILSVSFVTDLSFSYFGEAFNSSLNRFNLIFFLYDGLVSGTEYLGSPLDNTSYLHWHFIVLYNI